MNTLIYKALGGVALVLAIWFHGHHIGATSQQQADAQEIKQLKDDKVELQKQNTGLADTLRQVNENAKTAQEEADRQKAAAEEAKKQLAEEKKTSAANQQAWEKKLNSLTDKPECSALKEQICESAMDY